MTTVELVNHVQANFSRIYLGGIPGLLNDDGAYLSFICSLTAQDGLRCVARGKHTEHVLDREPAAADDRLASEDLRVHRDAVEKIRFASRGHATSLQGDRLAHAGPSTPRTPRPVDLDEELRRREAGRLSEWLRRQAGRGTAAQAAGAVSGGPGP